MPETSSTLRVAPAKLVDLVEKVYRAFGVPSDQAAVAATLMIESDLAGQDGHGIFRLPQYVEQLKVGGINVKPDIKVDDTGASTALVHGDNAFGHLVVRRAADLAIDKAKRTGVGWVGMRRSNHAGAAVRLCLDAAETRHDRHLLRGRQRQPPAALGRHREAFVDQPDLDRGACLDGAAAHPRHGDDSRRLRQDQGCGAAGQEMPVGWMIDREGNPLTDPNRAGEGFLLPIGGYKGYGLSLILGLLAGTLNGAAVRQGRRRHRTTIR